MAFDWVVYGSTPWDRAWYDEHNIAHALARDSRVLFVDPPMSPLTPVRGGAPAAALLRRRPVRSGRNLVFRPLALPPLEHPSARRWSVPLVRREIARAVRAAGLRSPVVLASRWTPGLEGAAGERARIAIVDDWVPAGAELIGRSPAGLLADLDAACAAADLVVVPSEALRETLGRRGHTAHLLPHGFPGDLRPVYDDAREPDFMRELPRPRLLYAGGIDGRLDFPALERLAASRPDATLVLVGPPSPRLPPAALDGLRDRSNVRLVGRRARDELPAAMVAADCLLLPYLPGEWARHGAPLKLWEYLYAGPPLAGTGYDVLAGYPPPLVHFGEGPGGLAGAVGAALAEQADGSDRRRAFALANTWDHRARALTELVECALAPREPPRADP